MTRRFSKDELHERREILADNRRFLDELKREASDLDKRHASEIHHLIVETRRRHQADASKLKDRISRTEAAIQMDLELLARLEGD